MKKKYSPAFVIMATVNAIALIGGLWNEADLFIGLMMLKLTGIVRKED